MNPQHKHLMNPKTKGNKEIAYLNSETAFTEAVAGVINDEQNKESSYEQ